MRSAEELKKGSWRNGPAVAPYESSVCRKELMALGMLFAEECFDFKGVGVEAELNRRQENQRHRIRIRVKGRNPNLKEPGFEHQRRLSRMILSMNMVNNGSV